jgi:hypothetical protein
MIRFEDFIRNGPRDREVLNIIVPDIQLPAHSRPKQGWTHLVLVELTFCGARVGFANFIRPIVEGGSYIVRPSPPLRYKPVNPQIDMSFRTDTGFIVGTFCCIYRTPLGYGDMILRHMGTDPNLIDEVTGWEGELPVKGSNIDCDMLREIYKKI